VDLHNRSQSAEPVEGKDDLTAQVLDWARDRTEALEGSVAATETKPSREAKRELPPRTIVVAFQEGTDDRGEAHLFEDLQAAGRFVETLVEEGLDQERLAVFNCTQLNIHLTYRAVVHLKGNEGQEEPAA
jgi:hypothetical protein